MRTRIAQITRKDSLSAVAVLHELPRIDHELTMNYNLRQIHDKFMEITPQKKNRRYTITAPPVKLIHKVGSVKSTGKKQEEYKQVLKENKKRVLPYVGLTIL